MLNSGPLNNASLNEVSDSGGSTPVVIPATYSSSSVQANYDILNGSSLSGGMVYEPKLVGYKRRYVGGNSYDSTKMGLAVQDVYETIKNVLIYAGFDLTESVITTDQDYKYIDIKQKGSNSIDSLRTVVFMPVDQTVLTLPYAVTYYGADPISAGVQFAIYTFDTLVVDVNTYPDLVPADFLIPNANAELTIVADGIRGIYWLSVANIANGVPLVHQFQVLTYSNRVPEDQSTPEQSCARYGFYDYINGFYPAYGVTYVFDNLYGTTGIYNNYYATATYSLLEGMAKFTTPQNGMETALIGNCLIGKADYYALPDSYQVNAPALFGPLEGIKLIQVTNPLYTWSIVNDGVSNYIYVVNDFYRLGFTMEATTKSVYFCPDNFTQLTDFT